jgi:hypothetical protein
MGRDLGFSHGKKFKPRMALFLFEFLKLFYFYFGKEKNP